MAESKSCPGDCKGCSMFQRSYCAVEMARNTQDMVARLSSDIEALSRLFHGEIVTPPAAGDAPASDAQEGAVQTIDPASNNT